MAGFRLRFPQRQLGFWSGRYEYPGESAILNRLAPRARERGYLTKPEFLQLTNWKTPRSQPRCKENSPALVEEVTRVALSGTQEELKIGVLLVLNGVSWPSASVILHFCDRAPYPILDFRALWSLGADDPPPSYTFAFWWEYTRFMRRLHARTQLDMRTLDRGLWQYSKENQL